MQRTMFMLFTIFQNIVFAALRSDHMVIEILHPTFLRRIPRERATMMQSSLRVLATFLVWQMAVSPCVA
eukprot:8828918-Pyramimonas_sp.AAC.1